MEETMSTQNKENVVWEENQLLDPKNTSANVITKSECDITTNINNSKKSGHLTDIIEKNNYYVYIYYDPRKNPIEPIYVGKGLGNRFMAHINNKCSNSILLRKINKIYKLGLQPVIKKVIINVSNEDAMKIERQLILKYGRIHLKNRHFVQFY